MGCEACEESTKESIADYLSFFSSLSTFSNILLNSSIARWRFLSILHPQYLPLTSLPGQLVTVAFLYDQTYVSFFA